VMAAVPMKLFLMENLNSKIFSATKIWHYVEVAFYKIFLMKILNARILYSKFYKVLVL